MWILITTTARFIISNLINAVYQQLAKHRTMTVVDGISLLPDALNGLERRWLLRYKDAAQAWGTEDRTDFGVSIGIVY